MRIFYLRDVTKLPVGCIVSEFTEDKALVRFAVSTYNPKDSFDRERAKAIAAARLSKGVFSVVTPEQGIKQRIVGVIAADEGYPQRLRDAARLWLDNRREDASDAESR